MKSGILLLKKRQIELIESNDKQHRQDSARMAEEIRVQHEQLQQQDSIREAFDQKLKEMEVRESWAMFRDMAISMFYSCHISYLAVL